MQRDSEAVAMPKGISASKRAAAEAEAPAPKRLRTLTPSRQGPDAEAGNSASSRAEQQAAAQQAAAAAASEPDLVISASEDDSDVEIIGETPAPDVLLVSETQADDVLEMKPSPQQLAAQAARQQKGKGIAGSQEPKPDPEQSNNSWHFTEFDFLPLYGLSEQQLACRKQNAASSSRGVSRQHALLQAFEEHRAQQMAAALQLEQEQAADAAAAAAAAEGGMLELDSEDDQPAAAAAAAEEEDMVIEDSQAEDEPESEAEFMPQQQQRQAPQERQPEQQQRQRHRQQQDGPAEAAAAAAAAAAAVGRRRRPAALPPPHARQQQPPRQQQQQQQQQQQRFAALEPGDPKQRLNRKLRAELHHLQEDALQQQEQLIDPKSGRLMSFMEQATALGKSAERPRENAVQTGVLATLAGMSSRMIASYRSTTAGNRPVDLLNALKRRFGQPGLLQQPQQQHGASALDWAGIGAAAAAAGMWQDAPGVSSMLGPLQQEAKVRKAAQRRQRAPVAAQVTPDEDPHASSAETQETDKWVETMRQVMSRSPSRVRLVALVVNHRSFSQTVENIFALSFLVKDMWCRLEKDPQRGLLVTCLSKEQREAALQQHKQQGGAAAAAAAAGASSGVHQFMLNIDMALWRDMCRVVAPGEALMPHREPVVQEPQE